MKKFLSVILALTMVIALVPAAFAADTDALVYKFCSDSYGYDNNSDGKFDTIGDARTLASYDKIVAEDTEPFRMVGTTMMGTKSFYSEASEVSFEYSVYNQDYKGWSSGQKTILALGLVVDKAGAMQTSVTYKQKNNSYKADVWLVRNAEIATADDIEMNKNTASSSSAFYDSNTTSVSYWEGVIAGENVQYLGSVDMQDGEQGKVCTKSLENVMVASGEYYLIFTFNSSTHTGDTCYTYLHNFTLTPMPEDTKLTEAFTVEKEENYRYNAPTVIGITADKKTVINATPAAGGGFNLTAPDMGKNFLYWALGLTGNKRIVSFDKTLENYVPAENGRNYLIAVYEGDVAADKKEFYNQNGQLITEADETTEVSMPGYGSTKKWERYGTTNIYVAQYEKATDDRDEVTVTVVNGTGGGTVLFGETVTCTADESKGTFKCWTKSKIYGATEEAPEIVSVDPTYEFKAWENCTVTAVYEPHNYTGNKMKIIIDTFDVATGVTGVMAEFIGLDDAVEKGIMFKATDATEATKIAMTTVGNQFTVIADEDGTYEGYAIVENSTGDGYTLITDGEYTE